MQVFARRAVLRRAAVLSGGVIASVVLVPAFASAAPYTRRGGTSVSSGASWCSADPECTITTPNGNLVTVHATVTAQGAVQQQLESMQVTVKSCTHVGPTSQKSSISLTVSVPNPPATQGPPFRYTCTISSLPNAAGTVYASTGGGSGVPQAVNFQLPIG